MWKLSLLLGAAALGGGFAAGWKVHDWRDAAGQLRAAQAAVHLVQRQAAASQSIAVANQRAEDQVRTVTRRLIERIPVHVTPQIDRAFPLPWGLVRVHDAAARGDDLSAVAEGAGQPDDAASDVPASEAGAVIAGNYGDCRADRRRLADLQAWVKAMRLAD